VDAPWQTDHGDGLQEVFYTFSYSPLYSPEGNIEGILVLSLDTTEQVKVRQQIEVELAERKQAEAALQHQNEVIGAINRVLQAGIQGQTDEQLGRTCLAIAEELTASRFGFIDEIGPDGFLHDLAISDIGWEVCMTVDKTGHRRSPGSFPIQGIYERVIVERKSLIANAPASHPDWNGLPEGHPPLTAFLGVPLILDGKPIGLVAVGNRENGYHIEEQAALESLAPAMVEALKRTRAERALRESEARFRTLADSNPILIWVTDSQGNNQFVNRTYCDFFGVTPEQASGGSWQPFIHPEDRSSYVTAFMAAVQAHTPFKGEMRGKRMDGEWRRLSTYAEARFSASGEFLGHVGNTSDITERQINEEETRARTVQIELHHRLLVQREQERQQIARDLHDGPVQALTGATFALRGLLMEPCAPEIATQLEALQTTMQEQINELRVYAGELRPPSLAKFGLGKAIRSHLGTFQEKHPEIQCYFDEVQDETRLPEEKSLALFRIFQETLVNILKHAQAAEVQIHLSQKHDQVALEIRDNGKGFEIPNDWLELARQGHLGLVGMRERAEAIGGQFEVYSQPGQGTFIRVIAPMASPES
jgi:PAS domain S-box-containing protein